MKVFLDVLLCRLKIWKTALQGVSILHSVNFNRYDVASGSEISNVVAEKKAKRA